eukprot:c29838_g1_i1 orf=314-2128(+)
MLTSTKIYKKNEVYKTDQRSVISRNAGICILFTCFMVLLVATISVVWAVNHADHKKHSVHVSESEFIAGSKPDQYIYRQISVEHLSSYTSLSLRQLVLMSSKIALTHIGEAFALAKTLSTKHGNGLENAAVQDCLELLDDASYHISNCITELSHLNLRSLRWDFANMLMRLSTALSYQTTCTDGFYNQRGSITDQMLVKQDDVSKVVVNAMNLMQRLSKLQKPLSEQRKFSSSTHSRRLLSEERSSRDACEVKSTNSFPWGVSSTDFPNWISAADRKLLQAPTPSVDFDAVVAKDGSALFSEIQDAIENIPDGYVGRYVIYIKKGIYDEIVTIGKTHQNITFLGDGVGKTIITGNRSVASGLYTTFQSATVAVTGQGFVARDITFRNTAGPIGHQAVAFRAGADLVVMDTCNFEGYQDTLYALSSRQFYRNCKIYGTVDFIFGNAAAVFQNCELLARQPFHGQQNTYTAQGRKVEADPTGFSFQNCTVTAADDLQTSNYTVWTYLGRPWKAYSRTVFLRSYLDSVVNPAGWLSWNSSHPYEDTLYYGEFQNKGPGAATSGRVNWTGIHLDMSSEDADQFSVEDFILGTSWLPQANVNFDVSLPI